MRTKYDTATSLDGFIATEDDSLDWLFPLGDLATSSYPAFIAVVGALAMGATSYEWVPRERRARGGRGGLALALHAADVGVRPPDDAAGGGCGRPLRGRRAFRRW